MLQRASLVILLVAACHGKSTGGGGSAATGSAPVGSAEGSGSAVPAGSAVASGSATGSAATPPAAADPARAKAILDAQVAAIANGDDATLVATFADDAVVLVPDPRLAHGANVGLREAVARLQPGASATSAKLGKVVADANDAAVWWSGELSVTPSSGKPTTIRLTELATAESGWKVVAGAFAESAPPNVAADPGNELDAKSVTPAGPLAPMLADPGKLSDALADKVVVYGTDAAESAYDTASAKKLLESWKKLSLSVNPKARELAGKRWAFAIANVDWKKPKEDVPARMSALVIAIPSEPPGGWKVVAVQYTPN